MGITYESPGDPLFTWVQNAGGNACPYVVLNAPSNGNLCAGDSTYVPTSSWSPSLSSWTALSASLHAAGVKVICYVDSMNWSGGVGTQRPLWAVENDMAQYLKDGFTVDGFFVDDVPWGWSNTAGDGSGSTNGAWYAGLYSYVHTTITSWNNPLYAANPVEIINPGCIEDVSNWMSVCDLYIDFEGPYASFTNSKGVTFSGYTSWTPAGTWVTNYPASRFVNLVTNATTTATVDAVFNRVSSMNAGYLYVTDVSCDWMAGYNTYGTDPSQVIWNEEVADAAPPAAPAGLSATAGSAQATLSWSASAGATSYNIYRGTSSGGESATPIATGVTTTSYTNTGLTNGTTYYYKVAAVSSGGTSPMSNEASATPAASTSTIYNETETVSGSNVTFTFSYTGSWTYFHVFLDTDLNASTGYQIGGIGANYMIENDGLYKSTSNSTTWSWSYAGSVTYSNSGGVATFTLPLSSIGSPSHMNVIYQVVSSSGSSYTSSKFSY